MSLYFFRKFLNTGLQGGNSQDVPVSDVNPLPVRPISDEEDEPVSVKQDGDWQPAVAGQQIVRKMQIPGIGTGADYADGEAFGTGLRLQGVFRANKNSGVIVKVLLYDADDEGLQVDLAFFSQAITAPTDNSAFAPTDLELLDCVGVIPVSTFYNWSANQMGVNLTDRLWVQGASTDLWVYPVARAALNIAAGAIPWVEVTVIPD